MVQEVVQRCRGVEVQRWYRGVAQWFRGKSCRHADMQRCWDAEVQRCKGAEVGAMVQRCRNLAELQRCGGAEVQRCRCRCRDAEMQRCRDAEVQVQRCRYLGGEVMQRWSRGCAELHTCR